MSDDDLIDLSPIKEGTNWPTQNIAIAKRDFSISEILRSDDDSTQLYPEIQPPSENFSHSQSFHDIPSVDTNTDEINIASTSSRNISVPSVIASDSDNSSMADHESDFHFWVSKVKWKLSMLSIQLCNLLLTIFTATTTNSNVNCPFARSINVRAEHAGNSYNPNVNVIQIALVFILGVACINIKHRFQMPRLSRHVESSDFNPHTTPLNDFNEGHLNQ